MGLDGGNAIEIQVRMVTQSQLVYTKMEYSPTGDNTTLSAQNCTEAFWEAVSAEWLDCITEQTRVLSVQGRIRGNPNAGLTYTKTIDFDGTVVGDTLPVWVTATMTKYPDNETAYNPDDATPFKLGRVSISGIPESFQNRGVLTSAGLAALAPLANVLRVIPASIAWDTPELGMMITRYANGLFVQRAWVTALTPSRVGSQLTRK